jgi:hypothetical protein
MDMTYAKSIGASHAAAISNAVNRGVTRTRGTHAGYTTQCRPDKLTHD